MKLIDVKASISNLNSGVFAFVLIAIVNLTILSIANAEEAPPGDWLKQATQTIKKQDAILKKSTSEKINVETLSNYLNDINDIKGKALECITGTETQLQKVTEDLKTLGKPSAKESKEVIKKRSSLSAMQKELDKQLSSCKLLQLQSQDLIKAINKLQQKIIAERLSAQTANILTVLVDNIKAPAAGWKDSIEFLRAQYKLKLLSVQQLILLILLVIIAVVSAVYFSRRLTVTAPLTITPKDNVSAFVLAFRTSMARALPLLFPVGVTAAFLSIALPLSPLPFVTKATYMLGTYLSLMVLINILISPIPPALTYITQPDLLSRRFGKQLKILVSLCLLGLFLLTGEFKASLSEPVYLLGRGIFSVLLIINLIAILWTVRLFSWAILSRSLRIFIILVLFSCLLAELAGYRNLSSFVLGGILATAACLGFAFLIYRFTKEICDGMDEGRLEWEKKIRDRVGLRKDAMVPGLIWIRLILFIGIWGSFAYLSLHIWNLDDPWLAIIISYLTDGFQIGTLNITPTRLATALLAFAVTLHLLRYIKNHVVPHGLKYTKLDRGAREAVASLVGYLGIIIAILIALSVTGVKMQNIAIIAGALSVGIGFGLQSIVNNFISGLILLFERPIRRGDWIVTGDTEGYVKSINIRSTQIETFDRADVIVPNSELITAKVTNWMLRDPFGRILIPIGVSYDADVEKAYNILLDIALNHPMVVTKHRQMSEPKVLFRKFGDSALELELRCFIKDIDQRLNVISELNFAIVAAFRREGIEIPFPQRVVTVANWKDKN
ncbi:MAG: mechanosensitive ion channel [Gammaproteobacteria bacterium]|nr:mechanosensitive ion channel [Gammaproteobacteria bacterium]